MPRPGCRHLGAGLALLALALTIGCDLDAPPARITDLPPPPAFAAAPRTADRIRIAVVGDYGTSDRATLDVAALVRGWDPDLVITTGDNNYPDGAESTIDANIGRPYQGMIAPYRGRYGPGADRNRFFPSLGNHDWDTARGAAYFNFFDLPGNERYYAVSQGPVRLYALDSDPREPDGVDARSAQAAWLRAELTRSDACWDLVYFHHPPYSSGTHGSSTWMRWPFAAWGAEAVLAGHDHTYERLAIDGLPYLVNGLGGRSIYRFRSVEPGSLIRYNADYGALRIEADRSTIVFEFINRAGELIDRHSQTRDCPEPIPTTAP